MSRAGIEIEGARLNSEWNGMSAKLKIVLCRLGA